MKAREFKRIWGHSYDFAFLLKIEQRKIKEMARDFAKWQHHIGWQRTVWEMNVCVRLIDIILEQDKYYQSWLHASFGDDRHCPLVFPIHVNVKNCKRFFKNRDFIIPEDPVLYNHWIPELRKKKALHLYHKIRNSKIYSWWD